MKKAALEFESKFPPEKRENTPASQRAAVVRVYDRTITLHSLLFVTVDTNTSILSFYHVVSFHKPVSLALSFAHDVLHDATHKQETGGV